MGAVFLAQHTLLGRRAAVKVLRPELSRDQEAVSRFFNEARAATMIRHGGIVDVFDFGTSDEGNAFLLMEFLEGESFSDRMERLGQMPESDVIRFGRQVATALAAAHREGIIHRDLKPDNLFIVADGEVTGGERIKILDFGIAKLVTDEGGGTETRTGTLMGTPLYMAPEQCRGAGGDIDGRVDCYALGCVLYEMLCGRPPFLGSGPGEVISKHIYEAPSRPRTYAPGVSEAMESLVLSCLAKDPDERIASMDRLVAAFDRIRKMEEPARGSRSVGRRAAPAALAATEGAATALPDAGEDGSTTVEEAGAALPPAEATSAPWWEASPPAARPPSLMSAAPSPQRRLAIAGLFAVVVVALVAAAMLIKGAANDDPKRPESAAAAAIDAGMLAARAADLDAATSPAADGARETVLLRIESRPRGASVFDADDVYLGTTPLKLKREREGKPVTFAVRADGYAEARVELTTDRDRQHEMVLERRVNERRERQPPRRTPANADDEPAPEPDDGGDAQDESSPPPDPFASRR